MSRRFAVEGGSCRVDRERTGDGGPAGPGVRATGMRHQKRRPAHRTRRRLQLERVMGIEPTLSAWEAGVLTLNYTRTGRQSMPAARVMAIRGVAPVAGPAGPHKQKGKAS